MHTKTIQKIQKAYIKTYEEDVKICKDIENSQVSQQPGLKGPYNLQIPAQTPSPATVGGSQSSNRSSWVVQTSADVVIYCEKLFIWFLKQKYITKKYTTN